MNKNLIILTGYHGNLGRNLRRELSDSCEIVPLSLRESTYIETLNRIASCFPSLSTSAKLVHTAWPVSNPQYRSSNENLQMLDISKDLIDKFVGLFGGEVIGIGSILEVGISQDVHDYSPANPSCKYSESKAELAEWILAQRIPGKWLRVGYQFSKFDPRHKLIPALLNSQLSSLQSPDDRLDFIHVSDVARAIKIILDAKTPDCFLVSTGRSISSQEIAVALGQNLPRNSGKIAYVQNTHPKVLQREGFIAKYLNPTNFYEALNSEVYER